MRTRYALVIAVLALGGAPVWAQWKAGPEFRINEYDDSTQWRGRVAHDRAGNFVVAWESWYQDGAGGAIAGRRFTPSGLPLGSEAILDTYTSTSQILPSIAVRPGGGYVVVWTSEHQDGDGFGIFGRQFDAAGQPASPEFRVNAYTTGDQLLSGVAAGPDGGFVVVWWENEGADGMFGGIFSRRFDSAGAPIGGDFLVNTYTYDHQYYPSLAMDAEGRYVVVWDSFFENGWGYGVYGQRFDASGNRMGEEFAVSTDMFSDTYKPHVAMDAQGGFVVAYANGKQEFLEIFARRFDSDGNAMGAPFRVNTSTSGMQLYPAVACDGIGNFTVVWDSFGTSGISGQRYRADGTPRGGEFIVSPPAELGHHPNLSADTSGNLVATWTAFGTGLDLLGQRFGGLVPTALAVETGGDRILQPGESADVQPTWRNVSSGTLTFSGVASKLSGPAAAGVAYRLTDKTASYGTLADGASAACTDCYRVSVSWGGTRPALHWDATLDERITPNVLGQTRRWVLHVGDSFDDVPRGSAFYRPVEAMLHHRLTSGCGAGRFCPSSSATREQMAAFVLLAREGARYRPARCAGPPYADVPADSPFCPYIQELTRRGVAGGCGGGNYCPAAPVTREQMAVFVLRTLDPALDPPACTTPVFADVPASSPFCRWIEELARRGVVSGCGDGNYCPAAAVTREQMAVFITATFGLTLYGP